MYADLHLHSTASDGLLSPSELVGKAKNLDFKAIALTDHDTVSGLAEAVESALTHGLEVIKGIELSAIDKRVKREVEVHILGYYIDPENQSLTEVLKQIREIRQNRAVRMVEKLNNSGVSIDFERVKVLAEGEAVGRPHIARVMVEAGYINDVKDAFSKEYIGRDGRAYVERYKISPQEAIKLLIDAGGVAVLAHPGYLSDGSALGEDEIREYKEYGLTGLEVYYSKHSKKQLQLYKKIAEQLGLLITGGSDCHGGVDALIGRIKLPYTYVEALKNARR